MVLLLCGTGVNEGKDWEVNGRHQIYVYDKEKGESRINNIEDIASGRYLYDFCQRIFLPDKLWICHMRMRKVLMSMLSFRLLRRHYRLVLKDRIQIINL